MIALTDIEPDTKTDLIGAKIAKFQAISRWTKAKHRLRADLETMLRHHGYKRILTDYRDYQMHRVGQSFQYAVPADKRGKLEPFRGQRVRLVVIRSGKFRALTMVGVVNEIDIGRRVYSGVNRQASLQSS